MAELAAGGERAIEIATSDDEEALAMVSMHRAVESIDRAPSGIRITLAPDVDASAAADDISRRLVQEGLAIRRFEHTRASLEQRFMEVTS